MPDALCYTSAQGSYILDGYDSIIRFAPMFLIDGLTLVELLRISYLAAPQTPPSDLKLRVGASGQTADPNTGECGIVWFDHEPRPLKCLAQPNGGNYKQAGTVPAQPLEWYFWRQARFIYVELRIGGTGGDASFTGVMSKATTVPSRNY